MKKIFLTILFLLILCPHAAISAKFTPDCYKNAEYPAHKFPFVDKEYFEAVSIDPMDTGKCLPPIAIYRGEPLVRQPLYAPLGNLYSSYVKGMTDQKTFRRIAAYLKPAPRNFREWFELYSNRVMPPENLGGTKKMEKLIDLLKPGDREIGSFLYSYYDRSKGRPIRVDYGWLLLFLFMGGDILPDCESVPSEKTGIFDDSRMQLQNALDWRFPVYSVNRGNGFFTLQQGEGSCDE